jgi:YD repeat-containing protein
MKKPIRLALARRPIRVFAAGASDLTAAGRAGHAYTPQDDLSRPLEMVIRASVALLAAIFSLGVMPVYADEYAYQDYAAERIENLTEIPHINSDIFGERFSPYRGTLAFEVEDVLLKGNGPAISIRRRFDVISQMGTGLMVRNLADWDLELPRMETFVPDDETDTKYSGDPHARWLGSDGSAARCTKFGLWRSPVEETPSQDWWPGVDLVIPGYGHQDIQRRASNYTLAPTLTVNGSVTSFPLVTKQNWAISCLGQTKNGQPGEGFLAVSPDGTKYWFDWMTFEWAGKAVGPSSYLYPPLYEFWRTKASLLVTRVEDRFGNYVTYRYDGRKLVEVSASDGRHLTLDWISKDDLWGRQSYDTGPRFTYYYLEKVTVQPASATPRVWKYVYGFGYPLGTSSDWIKYQGDKWYNAGHLRNVILPDGSSWRFDLEHFSNRCPAPGYCNNSMSATVGSITAPSGLKGSYTIGDVPYESVPGRPWDTLGSDPGDEYVCPNDFYCPTYSGWARAARLTTRKYSGPGIDYTWTYRYPYQSGNAYAVAWITDPLGGRIVFGTDARSTDLLSIEPLTPNEDLSSTEGNVFYIEKYHAGSTEPVYVESLVYASSKTHGFLDRLGTTPLLYANKPQLERLRPLQKRVIKQDGVEFVWEVNSFDILGRPTNVTRSGVNAAPVTETINYHDDLPRWVLGQVERTTSAGVETARTVFDSETGLPIEFYEFGKLKRTLTFDTSSAVESGQRGTIKTYSDGRDSAATDTTTSLLDWKRGIPQRIENADRTAKSAVVDEFGDVRSETNESGATTFYDYDPLGRLRLVDYANDDVVDWHSTVISFRSVDVAEYGIGAGHWKQTVTTGNARRTLYLDALWRPLIDREEDATDPNSVRAIAKRYDHEGRTVAAYYPQDGSYTSYGQFTKGVHTTYDVLGRVKTVRQDAESGQVLETKHQYLTGLETLVTNARAQPTRTRYMALGVPTYDYPVRQFLPEGVEVTIARDQLFKPTQLTRSGADGSSLDRFYFYDQYQRLCRTFEPETGATIIDYDGADNVAWSAVVNGFWGEGCRREEVSAASRIVRTYDARNRPTYLNYPAGTDDITMVYEPTGEVKYAKMGGSEWRYLRNRRGLVTQESMTMDGEVRALDYTYTLEGHLASVRYPRGRTVAYAPNALGQPTQAGGYVADVRYWPEGDIKSMRYANDIAFTTQKNERRLPSNRTYASSAGALLYSQDLSYDPNANLSAVSDLAGIGLSRSKTMTYDWLDRLKTASAPGLWGAEAYTYDALDNIRSRVKDGQTYIYGYDGLNRLRDLKIGSTTVNSYWYDLYGNVSCRSLDGCINGGGLTFDLSNRLQTYEGVQAYQYDAWGRRVRKSDLRTGAETQSLYSQAGQLMVEHDSAANTISDYVYLGSTMVAKVSDTLPLLVAPTTSGGGFALTWPSGSAVRYVVEESADFGAWTAVYDGAALTWSASGRAPGTYRYRIKACTAEGVCTTYTSAVTVKVMPDLTPIIYELLLN